MAALRLVDVGRAESDHDGCSEITLVAHAQNQVIDPATSGQGGRFSMKHQGAVPCLLSAHFDSAPIDPPAAGLERLECGFLCGKPRCETRSRNGFGGGAAIRRLVRSERAPDVTIAEPMQCGRYLSHEDDVDANAEGKLPPKLPH
jgi:hypothetical protein